MSRIRCRREGMNELMASAAGYEFAFYLGY
jgi:hypothetical protein